MPTLSLNLEETGFDTIPQDQLTFGSINPVEGDELSPPEPLIDRSTAEQYLHDLPTATPADQWRMRRSLSAFRDEVLRRRRAAEDDHIEKLVTDEGYQNHMMNTPEFVAAMQYQSEPNGLKHEAVTRAYLAHSLGKPIGELEGDGVADAFRDAYALRYFGKTKVTNSEFVGLVKGQYTTRNGARKKLSELGGFLVRKIFDDQTAGRVTSAAGLVRQWETENKDIFRREWRKPLLSYADKFIRDTEPWMREKGPEAQGLFKILASSTEREDAADFGDPEVALSKFASMSRAERMPYYQMAALYSGATDPDKVGDWRTTFRQAGEAILRTVTETGVGFNAWSAESDARERISALESPLRPTIWTSADGPLWPRFGIIETDPALALKNHNVRPATEAERSQMLAKAQDDLRRIEVAREFRHLATGEIDPIKPVNEDIWGMVEQGVYDVAGSAPLIGAAMIPGAGAAIVGAAMATQENDRLAFQYPDLDPGQRQVMSIVGGAGMGLWETLQAQAILGRLPITGKILEEFSRPGRTTFQRILVGSGLNFGEQYTQEVAQNITPAIVDAVAKGLGADMPEWNGARDLEQLKDSLPQTAMSLLIPWGIGTGFISFSEMKRGEQFRADVATFEDIGFSSEESRAIANAATPEEADVEFRKAWKVLPLEKKASLIARTDAANRKAESDQLDTQAPTLEQQGNQWVIVSPDGDEYRYDDKETAQTAYFSEVQRLTRVALLRQETEEKPFNDGQVDAENDLFGIPVDGRSSADENGSVLANRPGQGGVLPNAPDDGGAGAEEARSFRDAFGALGVRLLRSRGDDERSAFIEYDDTGAITLHFHEDNIKGEDARAQKFGMERRQATRLSLGEELIHAAHLTVLRNDWEAAGRPGGSFTVYVEEANKNTFTDIRTALEAPELSSGERFALHQAVADVYKTYFGDYTQETDITPGKIFDRIAGDRRSVKFVNEMLRKTVQLRRQGEIRESVLAKITRALADWVHATIARVKKALPGVYEGKFGPEAKRLVESIENELDSIQGKPPAKASEIKLPSSETGTMEGRALDSATRRAMMDDTLEDSAAPKSRQSTALKMSKQGEAKPADIGRHWLKIAEDPETAILGETPTEKDFKLILKKLGGAFADSVTVEEEVLPTGEPNGLVIFRESPREQITLDASNPDEIYINSQYAGKRGTLIYQAIYAWAQNNGKQIVGDPAGLNEIGAFRRTSQMFNSALRFKSTAHLIPHPNQKLDGWKEDNSPSDIEHNIGLLAMREAALMRERLPGLADLRYSNGQFYAGETAIPSNPKDRDDYLRGRIGVLDRNFTKRAGPATIGRALVTLAAQEASERDRLVGTSSKTALKGLRYSRAEASAPLSESKQSQVTDWLSSALKDWRKDISVKIHDSADLIPDENLRQTVLNEGGAVEGFYNPADRSIHILADRMNSAADVQRVLRHEGMHWAFANALQKEYRELLAGARAKIPTEKIDELLAKYPKASDATIVEEYLAYEGQNNPQSTAWRTFVYEAKILLRKVFGDRVEFTEKDILAFLSKANRRLEAVQTHEGATLNSKGQSSKRPFHSVGIELRDAEKAFRNLGIPMVQIDDFRVAAQVRYLPNGEIQLEYNPRTLISEERRAQTGGADGGELTKLTFGEELIHAAHLSKLLRDWKLSSRTKSFDKYVEKENLRLFEEMRQTLNDPELSASERSALLETVEAVYASYFADFEHLQPEKIKEIFAEIERKQLTTTFIAEFIRQAVQLKKHGVIREQIFAKAFKKIAGWVKSVLETIKANLPGAYQGDFGAGIKATLEPIDALLKEIE